jgi:putative FmdB family regulatory protein
MPRYLYECETCGPFRAWARMNECLKPMECPACQTPRPRVIAAPFIARMKAAERIAHARNERSAHEPMVMSRQELERSGPRRHGHSHAGHKSFAAANSGASRLESNYRVHTAPHRPWLIGH